MLLFDPLAALTAGFWLSFAGVAWLAWCLPDAGKRIVGDFLSAQGVATLGLLPLTVVLFGQASLAGPLANLVAIPWWSLGVRSEEPPFELHPLMPIPYAVLCLKKK